jgi:hypothetical protein
MPLANSLIASLFPLGFHGSHIGLEFVNGYRKSIGPYSQ